MTLFISLQHRTQASAPCATSPWAAGPAEGHENQMHFPEAAPGKWIEAAAMATLIKDGF